MAHTIVMVSTSYPRFTGDTVGTFLEPIAQGIAARGHAVHVVLPWHPQVDRAPVERGVHLHYFRYAPASLSVFGYAQSLRADVHLKATAYLTAPLASIAAILKTRQVARRYGATILHGHWVVPGGAIAALAAATDLPLAISLHGSDVYVAERYSLLGHVARWAFSRAGWVTACSEDLRQRAIGLGASKDHIEVLPYGVDAKRFSPDPATGAQARAQFGVPSDAPLILTAGRLVRKKGFEFLIDAMAKLAPEWPELRLMIVGGGDLDTELRQRARDAGLGHRVTFTGNVLQDAIPSYLNAADLAIVPSVKDAAGNVDGLPNFLLEALVSGTAVVTTDVGGISSVAKDGYTAAVVPPANPGRLADAIDTLLRHPERRRTLATAARTELEKSRSWATVAERFELIYDRLAETSSR